MAIGSILSSIGGAAASAGASSLVNGLFGGGGAPEGTLGSTWNRNAPNVNGSALTIDPFKNSKKDFGYNIGIGPGLQGALDQFRSLSEAGAGQLGRLQEMLRPGFSAFRQAGLDAINTNRTRTVGDLRNDLARRRVLGSSFANDTISRAEADFAQQQAQFEAQTFLQEIDATVSLIQQQNNLRLNAVSQELAAQTDIAGISASLVTGITNSMTALAQTNASIAAQNAASNAQGLGAFFQPSIDQLGSSVSDWITQTLSGGSGGGGT